MTDPRNIPMDRKPVAYDEVCKSVLLSKLDGVPQILASDAYGIECGDFTPFSVFNIEVPQVFILVDDDRAFLINREGAPYARYVARVIDDLLSLEDRLADEAMREHMDPVGFEADYILGCQITERLALNADAANWGDDEYGPDEAPHLAAERRQDEIEAWSPLMPEGYDIRRTRETPQVCRFDFGMWSDEIAF